MPKPRACIHFAGALAQPPCEAGIDLVAKCGPRVTPGWLRSIPCLAENDAPKFACKRRQFPMDEDEAAAFQDEHGWVGQTIEVMKSIGRQKPGSRGELPCPRCGMRIFWATAPGRGHLRFMCETDGCLAGIE